jgi:hypothetical protein
LGARGHGGLGLARICFFPKVLMERLTIACESCERLWTIACSLSLYEQQAMESRPCPHCGAYTLSCQDMNALVAAGPRSVTWSSFAA